MLTEKDLKEYRLLGVEAERLEESKVRLKKQIETFQASKYQPIAKDERKTLTDALIRMERLEEEYIKRITEIMKRRLHVESFIDSLDDPEERIVMRLRYIEGDEWEQVCVKVYCGWDKVHRINRSVLERIA